MKKIFLLLLFIYSPSFAQLVQFPKITKAGSSITFWANGDVIDTLTSGTLGPGAGGSGTVTSVGLALPAEFTISGSPVTSSGTLTGTWANQTTNKFFISPNGSTGTPAFRAMVTADIPNSVVTYAKIQNVSANSVLLGSSASGSGAAPSEIVLGTGLSMTGSTLSATGSGGTVTSVDASGGTTGLTFSGGPVTTSGTLTLAGTLAIANGGTGQTTAGAAFTALGPSQTSNAGLAIVTDGSAYSCSGVSRTYDVTLGVDSNSSAENTLIQATIPANEWRDHQTIRFDFLLVSKNNTGSTQTFTPRFYWGANAFSFGGQTVSTSATIGMTWRHIWATRVGTSIYITNTTQTATFGSNLASNSYTSTAGGGPALTSQTFTASTVIKFTQQFNTANGENYWSCIGGSVVKE